MKQKRICILGSTGSVGRQAIEVCRENGFAVTGLSAERNIALLEEQIREFHPRYCAVGNEKAAAALAVAVADTDTKVLSGAEGICELAQITDADLIENSILGSAGIRPTMAAIAAGKDLAIANKEPIVAAGEIILKAARGKGVRVLPVDSEHSAIFQCLSGGFNAHAYVSELVLTASGGPFFGKDRAFLETVTPEMAVAHPVWNMGQKISVDSASLLNKGLEVIEAVRLFGIPAENVKVTVHRQSIVHSMVTFVDGSTIAQLGYPDMRHCVQFAFTYPERTPGLCKKLDFSETFSLTFEPADEKTFSLLPLARRAVSRGGTFPTVLNAANEAGVALFLDHKIRFPELFSLVEEAVENHRDIGYENIEGILALDHEVKQKVFEKYRNEAGKF